MLNFIQVNLQHSRAATATLKCFLARNPNTLAVIQEPWIVQNRVSGLGNLTGNLFSNPKNSKARTCIYAPANLHGIILPQFCNGDLTVIGIRDENDGETLVASCYLPYDSPSPPPGETLVEVVSYCEAKKKPLIIGCDANAHNTVWGSSNTNERGRVLSEYLSSTNLGILNRGCEPTFVTSRRQEVIDITLASMSITMQINNWHVSTEASMSDHRWICFSMDLRSKVMQPRRNPKRTNRDLFCEQLRNKLQESGTVVAAQSQTDIETQVKHLTLCITSSYENSCPLSTPRQNRDPPWWGSELRKRRGETRKAFNKAKNSGNISDWDKYKDLQRLYKKEIRSKQRESWRNFCEGIESTSEISRLKKVLSNDPQLQPGVMRTEQGELTDTPTGSLMELLKTHFPGCQVNQLADESDLPDHSPSEEDWDISNSVVTNKKVEWAVNSFSPFKSPGQDGVFPCLLQWGLPLLLPHLVKVFKECLSFRYIPQEWRMVRVVFIPKPGRDDYTLPKSFRPISLTSFLLKTLERLCDRFLRDDIVSIREFHPNQHAYIPGRSTESALHQAVSRIEGALINKMSTLGVFIDIEGAFDKATFESIGKALREKGAPNTICGWIDSMLSQRHIIASQNDIVVTAQVARGCPQGGVLSPLLWNMVVDSLLHQLNRAGFFTIGYADDITILLNGKFEGVLCNLMQAALQLVEGWCTANSLSVNPSKTELVLFTRKRKTEALKLPALFGINLQLSKEVKYLGITLDQKLNWSKHLDTKINKANKILWQCRRAVGQTWGLTPKVVLWLYTAIVRPALCYGAVVWWTKTNLVTAKAKMQQLQRVACLGVTGAMRSTPTTAIEVLLCIPPLDLFVREWAVRTALRLKSLGLWNDRGKQDMHRAILVREAPELLNRVESDAALPTFVFNKTFHTDLEENQVEAQVKIYSDGSKTNEGVGVGIYSAELNLQESIPLIQNANIFQAEVYGIMISAKKIVELEIRNQRIQILSDSKSAITALSKTKTSSKLIQKCVTTLEEAALNNELHLSWVKGHSGNEGNCKADELARSGARPGTADKRQVTLTNGQWKEIMQKRHLQNIRKDGPVRWTVL